MCLVVPREKTRESELVPKQFLPTSEKASWQNWRFKMKHRKKGGMGKKEKKGREEEKKKCTSAKNGCYEFSRA